MNFLSLTKSDPQQSQYLVSILNSFCQKLARRLNPEYYSVTPEEPNESSQNFQKNSNFIPAIERLTQRFNLSSDEREILLLTAGLEFNPSFSNLIIQANQNNQIKHLTLPLIATIFPNSSFHIHHHSSPLVNWQLISIGEGRLTESPIKIDRRIYYYLLGSKQIDISLQTYVQHLHIDVSFPDLSSSHQEIVRQIAQLWSSRAIPRIQLVGSSATSKVNISAVISQETEYSLYSTSIELLSTDIQKLNQFALLWQREYLLNPHILLLDCSSLSTSNLEQQRAINFLLSRLSVPIIITSRQRLELPSLFTTWEIPPLTLDEQRTAWQASLGQYHPQLKEHIDLLVSNFQLTSGEIAHAANTTLSLIDEAKKDSEEVESTLWNSCRVQARTSLDNLAQRLDAKATWDDLILPPDCKQLLAEIISQVRQKTLVYEHWGFGGKSNRGYGICALFAGVSGTGKTMAAEVIAGELNLDLYRIDLSTVVSKYIGETEKNLSRLFDAAEKGGAILLFDEADSLFGKRTEVTDAKDKYANMEVSYLLQRMEAYRGLAILTTNIKDALDSAFKRRLRFIVDFAFPDVTARTRMWQRVFPAQTPTKGLDFQALARLDLTGGNIRSIALNAAFEAAKDSESVMMKHIAIAARKESLKLGLGNWALSKVFQQATENTDNQPEKNRESQQATGKTYGEEDLSLEQLIKFASLKLQQEDYATAYRLARKAVAKNPHDSTANYWWGWTGYHLDRPLEELLSAFSKAEHGNQEWWRVREEKAATWYWQGKIHSLRKAEPQTIIDFYQRYLADFPRGYYAAEAMQGVQNAKMELLFGKPPE